MLNDGIKGGLGSKWYSRKIADVSVDIEKIIEILMIIEVARKVILRLNVEEKDIVERLYFYDEN